LILSATGTPISDKIHSGQSSLASRQAMNHQSVDEFDFCSFALCSQYRTSPRTTPSGPFRVAADLVLLVFQ
jgi:hypothetical protein